MYCHSIIIVSCSFSISSRDYHSETLYPLSHQNWYKTSSAASSFIWPILLKTPRTCVTQELLEGKLTVSAIQERLGMRPWETGRRKAVNSIGEKTETNWSRVPVKLVSEGCHFKLNLVIFSCSFSISFPNHHLQIPSITSCLTGLPTPSTNLPIFHTHPFLSPLAIS